MENIFNNSENAARTPTAKQTTIKIDRELLDKLKKLNKGTPNQAINYLLGNSADQKVLDRIRTNEQEIIKLQELLEKIVSINRLRY